MKVPKALSKGSGEVLGATQARVGSLAEDPKAGKAPTRKSRLKKLTLEKSLDLLQHSIGVDQLELLGLVHMDVCLGNVAILML